VNRQAGARCEAGAESCFKPPYDSFETCKRDANKTCRADLPHFMACMKAAMRTCVNARDTAIKTCQASFKSYRAQCGPLRHDDYLCIIEADVGPTTIGKIGYCGDSLDTSSLQAWLEKFKPTITHKSSSVDCTRI
jgi:hypothetical protein